MACVNKPHINPDGSWAYPPSELILEEGALHPITYYVEVRRQTIAKFIVNQLIFNFCTEGERRRGSSPRQYWREQTMDLEAVRDEAQVSAGVAAEDSDMVE